MAQYINTNIAALDSQRNLTSSQSALQLSLQRLSSGLRVNSAKDDAAGLAIAERITSQVTGMNMAARNANDGISLSQTAEGALNQVGLDLQRMRELAVQGANGSLGSGDRANLNNEYQTLGSEVTRILTGTFFNGQDLLGTGAAATTFQVGANNVATDQISVTLTDMTAGAGITAVTAGTTLVDATGAAAKTAMDDLSTAIDEVTTQRAALGAAQNRFTGVISNLQTAVQNESAARSRIMDTDFAQETSSLTRAQILQQAGTAMLAQANASNNGVMALLR